MDEGAAGPAHGTPEMIRQCAAECMELAATFFAAAAERLTENDLAGYRCAMRCAAAAAKCAREIAALLGTDAALDRPRTEAAYSNRSG
ncbi:hypothetical protein DK419_24210 [Methylobacterium terrae]|uniref:Uncharacterized protein n=1 Tax=Methylobacterium terrae TaxID=2202827 RepID=A0A2U8WSN7_9HYPH|nr:hypothetical protein [Methylobacterium terrae]AWN49083.1 hypothetical protein DK419_24210 [Methylobacterium terrae]